MTRAMIQPEGNYYDKYSSRNPIERSLMNGFFKTLDDILDVSEISNQGEYCLEAGCGEGIVTEHIGNWLSRKMVE